VKRLASVAAAVVLGVASLAVTASPAQALPTDCSGWYHTDGQGGASYCGSGTGVHRVAISCDVSWWPDYVRQGPWEVPGFVSNVRCNAGDRAYGLVIGRA